MSILTIILVLICVGVLLWLVGMIPMDALILRIIRIVCIIAVVLWLLKAFGLLDALGSATI